MKQVFLLPLILFATSFCSQNKKTRAVLTVILYDNQNPEMVTRVDTLLNRHKIDLSKISIDLFFCNGLFLIPYYAPTGGIYKNEAKDKECKWEIYPANVKCYKYDSKNRVIEMSVQGSGVTTSFTYQYNDDDQITGFENFGTIYKLTYNANGTLSELSGQFMNIKKRLVFIYQ